MALDRSALRDGLPAFGSRASPTSTSPPRATASSAGRPRGFAGSTLRHFLLDQVLPLALSRSGRLVLHASAVHVPRLGLRGLRGPDRQRQVDARRRARAARVFRSSPTTASSSRPARPAAWLSPVIRGCASGVTRPGDWGSSNDAGARVAHYTAKRRLARGRRAISIAAEPAGPGVRARPPASPGQRRRDRAPSAPATASWRLPPTLM